MEATCQRCGKVIKSGQCSGAWYSHMDGHRRRDIKARKQARAAAEKQER